MREKEWNKYIERKCERVGGRERERERESKYSVTKIKIIFDCI